MTLVSLVGSTVPWWVRLALEWVPSAKKGFFGDDRSLQYPHSPSTVPSWALVLISLGLPLAIMGIRRDWSWMRKTVFYIGLVEVVVTLLKVMVGRHRPHFLSLCGPVQGYALLCPEEHLVLEARKSFPSGHSSMSFAGMTILVLYIYPHLSKQWKWMSLVPWCISLYIANSRLLDHHHHVEDVVVGALLGILVPMGMDYWHGPVESVESVPLSGLD